MNRFVRTATTLIRSVRRLTPFLGEDEGEDSEAPHVPVPDGGSTPVSGTAIRDRLSGMVPRSDFVESLPFWLPPFLLVGLFVYGAIAWNAVISLTDWEGLDPTPSYAGLDFEMYRRLLSDPDFWTAAQNTIVLLVVFTLASLALGLFLAILIDRGIRFENTFRTIYLLPMSLSFVVTAIFWAWMYNYNIGLINETIRLLGPDYLATQWLGNPQFKLFAVIFALIWQFSGYCMVVYLAGLRAIPSDIYEASKVDGASTIKMYWRIIIPQLRASTASAAVVLMVFALKAFDFLFVLFGTRPGPAADILAMLMYREAFGTSNWAYGSAIAMVLFMMALSVIAPYLYLQSRQGEL
ncbi:MAG: carbohydrate ABC transporter permease [Halodesulfurarchaeum sp.]